MGQDGRISPKFYMRARGMEEAASLKILKALARIAHDHGETISLIEATVEANEKQKLKMVDKIINAMGDVEDKTFAILGITFKPNTDDMRDAPALVILPELAKRGAKFKIYDPEGLKEGTWRLEEIKDSITWCETAYEAIASTNATVILTEWNEFRNLDFDKLREIDGSEYFF